MLVEILFGDRCLKSTTRRIILKIIISVAFAMVEKGFGCNGQSLFLYMEIHT